MAEYLVTWKIDVEADSPQEAAQMAREIQQDPESTATVFLVAPKDAPRHAQQIDLIPAMDVEDEPDVKHLRYEPYRDDMDAITPWTVRKSVYTSSGAIIMTSIGRYVTGGVAAAAADRLLKAHASK